MQLKKIFIGALMLMAMSACSQTPRSEFNAETYNPAYTLTVPEGWGVERFEIPIEFAPSIPYKGVEDIRFAPGWSDARSNEYWTYAFLWALKGKPETNSQTIEKNITAYYNGLVGRNIDKRMIPAEKLVPVKVSIKKVDTDKQDLQTFSGTIDMLDYMEQKPMTLNCIVHLKLCGDQNRTYLFYEISPKSLTDSVWKKLDQLWNTFDCNKTKIK